MSVKKLFTIDDFMVAFISALGYGFGETIARLSGWPEAMCIAASFALGIALEEMISGIVFSKAVQKSRKNRILTFAGILLFFLAAQFISTRWMGVSMLEYLQEEFTYVVGLPILGLLVNLCIRAYRVWRIRKLYGDGSKGYVFDLKKEDIEETNKQNQPITGSYDASLAVKTRTGIYVGEEYKKTRIYLGIPYAKPPVGDLRWKAPQPLPSSDAVFEATNFGPSAIQVDHEGSILKYHRQSEDCLYLNICVGREKTEEKKPVIVLFHHGDFTYEGSADPLLYGSSYISMHPDTVFVSFNYRLGIFGFIDFSGIPGGEAYPDARNLGLLDQIAALKWIRENIASFGGDPERVTALGFESGAVSIAMLAASSQAKGLFRKAFVFNGNLETTYEPSEKTPDLARHLMAETKTATIKELVRLDTESLKNASQKLWEEMRMPTCDGSLIPVDVDRAYQKSAAAGIEFIIGIPGNESKVMRSFIGDQKYRKMIEEGAAAFEDSVEGSLAAAVREFLKKRTALSSELEAKAELIEQWNTLCLYRSAARLAEGGNKVYIMYWNEKGLIENLGFGTVDAAGALLGNQEALQMYGSVVDKDMSEILQSFLQKFISGDALKLYPNEITGVDAIDWKAFPRALTFSDGKIECCRIDDRLTSIKGLFDFLVK